ncbi:MAG: hypothetical protein IIB54_01685 [Planctomycetes bacterium]|nr:hypothetical protein [Planctomycetota bacterium]
MTLLNDNLPMRHWELLTPLATVLAHAPNISLILACRHVTNLDPVFFPYVIINVYRSGIESIIALLLAT